MEVGYSGKEDEGKTALLKILRERAYEDLLYQYGFNINETELEQEYQRIHKETLNPDALKKIEEVFNDHKAFLDIFVRPVLVRQKLEKYFEQNRELLDPLKKQLKEKLEKIKNGEITQNGIKANQTITFTIDEKTKLNSRQNKDMTLNDKELNKITNFNQEGQFVQEIFEEEELYYLIRLDKINQDNSRSYTLFLFFKKNFGDWLKDQLNNIEIKISDPRLKNLLKQNFPIADIINSLR